MWNTSQLKRAGKKSLRRNYLAMIAVCFIISLLTNNYPDSSVNFFGGETFAQKEYQVVFDRLSPDTCYSIVSRKPGTDEAVTVTAIQTGKAEETSAQDDSATQINIAKSEIVMHNAVSDREYALLDGDGNQISEWKKPVPAIVLASAGSNSSILWNAVKKISKASASQSNDGDYGVINNVINNAINISTKAQAIVFRGFDAIANFAGNKTADAINSLISILLSALFTVFVSYILTVGERRFFLESRAYKDTRISRILFPYRERKTGNVAKIMLLKMIKTVLWSLTIVGGVIKYYEYRMIPYILADNPSISARDAFAQSKFMMSGNKWRLFLFDMSFVGWRILSLLLFGLPGIFFVNPYYTASETELYIILRKSARHEVLCPAVPGGPIIADDGTEIYADNPFLKQKRDEDNPRRLSLPDYNVNYSVVSYILLFFTFSVAGWISEVLQTYIASGRFVNRGTLFGPWLPIYGFGGIMILILLKRFRHNPVLTFGLSFVLCGVFEYFTGLVLELTKGVKYWNYSGYFLNIKGRVCLEGLLFFALGGCLFVYYLAPLCDRLFKKIPMRVKLSLCAVLIVLFMGDNVYSHFHPNVGKGITTRITAPVESDTVHTQ